MLYPFQAEAGGNALNRDSWGLRVQARAGLLGGEGAGSIPCLDCPESSVRPEKAAKEQESSVRAS